MMHTPTPYVAEGFDIYAMHPNGRRYQIAKAFSGWLVAPLRETVRAEQQAEFIVRACNCHTDLLDALIDLVERDRAEAAECGFTDDEMSWLEDARRAIAKAAGQGGAP